MREKVHIMPRHVRENAGVEWHPGEPALCGDKVDPYTTNGMSKAHNLYSSLTDKLDPTCETCILLHFLERSEEDE